MRNYRELQNELDDYQNRIEQIRNEKILILSPIHKIIYDHRDTLTNIIPPNIKDAEFSVLVIRLDILTAEIKESKTISNKEELLDLVSKAREKLTQKESEYTVLQNLINNLTSAIEQRKKYVYEKIDEQSKIASDTQKLEDKISARLNFLSTNEVESEEREVLNFVIHNYQMQIEDLAKQGKLINEDEDLVSDISILNTEDTPSKEKEESDVKEDTLQLNEEADISVYSNDTLSQKIKQRGINKLLLGISSLSTKITQPENEIDKKEPKIQQIIDKQNNQLEPKIQQIEEPRIRRRIL